MAKVNLHSIGYGEMLSFDYTNHKGIRARRRCTFRCLVYGSQPDYYPTPRFLIKCLDNDRGVIRDFDLAKVENITFD